MADPFSIVATVISLTGTALHVSRLIYAFTQDVREAPRSLLSISNELSLLCKIFARLETVLREEFDSAPPFPAETCRELREVLESCFKVLGQLEQVLGRVRGKKRVKGEDSGKGGGGLRDFQKRVKWVLEEKNIERIRVSLEAHKETLNTALIVTLNWNTSQINKDTKQILRLVNKLLGQNTESVGEEAPITSNPLPEIVWPGSIPLKNSLNPSEVRGIASHIDKASEPSREIVAAQRCKTSPMVKKSTETPQEPSKEEDKDLLEVTHRNEVTEMPVGDPVPFSMVSAKDDDEADYRKDVMVEVDEAIEVNGNVPAQNNEETASTETSEAVRIAVETGNLEMILLLLDFAGKVNVDDFNYAAALESAVTSGHEVAAQKLLEHGADVNAEGAHHKSPLLAAIERRNANMAKMLVSHGADVHKEGVLTQAVMSRTPRMVELLIKSGADVETRGPWGNNQLILATRNGDIDTLKVLLSHGADINGSGEYGTTALTVAIAHNSIPIIRFLLDQGAKANIDNAFAKAAQRNNSHEVLKILIDAGAEGISSQSCVASAAAAGDSRSIAMLVEAGANIEAKGPWSNSPIIYAVRSGKLEVLQTLLNLGADINATGEYGVTALTSAISSGQTEMIEYLVSQGADATIDNAVAKAAGRSTGHTYLKILRDGGAEGFLSQPCVAAAAEAGNEKSINLLLDAGADIEAKGAWSNGPLNFAARSGRVSVMRLLLDRGADIDATGEYKKTGLISAIEHDNLEMVKLLINRGADVDGAFIAAAQRNEGHRTIKVMLDGGAQIPVEENGVGQASLIGNLKSLTLLLDAGANVNGPCDWGSSPLMIAISRSQTAAAKMLVKRGADVNLVGGCKQTALQNAFEGNAIEMCEILLSKGITFETRCKCLEEALKKAKQIHIDLLMKHITERDVAQDSKGILVQLSLEHCRHDILKELLLRGADPNALGLIQAAVKKGDSTTVIQLLDAGVNVNVLDVKRGGSLLQVAAAEGQEEIIKVLFERGYDVNIPGCGIGPALTSALKGRHNEVAKLLMVKSKELNKS